MKREQTGVLLLYNLPRDATCRPLAAAWKESDAGILDHREALALGACGPVGRASGIDDDVRMASPRLWYDGFVAARPAVSAGDASS